MTPEQERLLREILQAEDGPALEHALDGVRPLIRRVARRMRVSPSEQDDLVQDVLLAVLVGAERFDQRRSFSSWVAGITQKRVLYLRRRRAQRSGRLPGTEDPVDESPAETIELVEVRAILHDSVNKLPTKYREVIELHFLDGMMAKEIAGIIQAEPSTVRTRIARALAILKRGLPAGFSPTAFWVLRLDGPARNPLPAPPSPPPSAASIPRAWLGAAALVSGLAAVGLLVSTAAAPEHGAPVSPGHTESTARTAGTELATTTAPRRTSAPSPPPELATGSPATVEQPVALRVRLVERDTGRPATDVVFGLERTEGARQRGVLEAYTNLETARSDEHGEARFEDLAPGGARLRFNASLTSAELDLRPGMEGVVEVPVEPLRRLAGVVFGPSGPAPAGVEIWAAEARIGSYHPPTVIARSEPDGSFAVNYSGARSHKTVWAQAPGLGISAPFFLERVRPWPERLALRLAPAEGRVRGRAFAPDGTPAAGVLITLIEGAGLPREARVFQRLTDASGDFELDTLPHRDFALTAVGPEGTAARTTVDLGTDPHAAVDVWLERGAVLTGRALDADGSPLAGALVAACPERSAPLGWSPCLLWRHRYTDADGRFQIPGLHAGEVELSLIDGVTGNVLAYERAVAIDAGELRWNPATGARPLRAHHRYRGLMSWLGEIEPPASTHYPVDALARD